MVVFPIECACCKRTYNLELTEDQAQRIFMGEEYIQDVLWNFSPAERELFISQLCGTCFDEMLSEEEEF